MKGKKVLVIDDEDYIRDLIKDFLSIKGIACDEAANAESAIQLIEKNHYDLILLDRNLEKRTAEEVVGDIRNITETTPMLLLTGDQGFSDEYVRNMGMNGIIYKPFQIEAFFETIKRFLEQT